MENKHILVFKFYFLEIEKILNHLNPTLGVSNNLYEKKVGVFHIFRSLYNNLKFLEVTFENSTTTAFTTLARMIIDHYSVFFLISTYSSKEIQNLRYYLLMIGSLEGRSKTMHEFEESLLNVPIGISANNQNSIKTDKETINKFLKKIEKENLEKLTSESNISKRNWKFPSEKNARNGKFYNWQELYQVSKIPSNYSKAIQNHFSEFTHGLGMTVLYIENNIDSKISIIAILSVIQSLIGKIMMEEFSEELQNIELNSNFVYHCNYNWENWK